MFNAPTVEVFFERQKRIRQTLKSINRLECIEDYNNKKKRLTEVLKISDKAELNEYKRRHRVNFNIKEYKELKSKDTRHDLRAY